MDEQFVNVYIATMSKRLEDSIKNEVLLQARLSIAEEIIKNMGLEIERLNLAQAPETAPPKKTKSSE